ncbi:unnamed protein product [Phytomonas sp. Hart1]|nr:unnamed protein product [Phytomonas sp. Hart1]|eukprot:CCW69066.1 unnamed protein product [Phytomonas sp. isolate Hart1]
MDPYTGEVRRHTPEQGYETCETFFPQRLPQALLNLDFQVGKNTVYYGYVKDKVSPQLAMNLTVLFLNV